MNPIYQLYHRQQIPRDELCMFGEESKIEWYDGDVDQLYLFACPCCDWGGSKPISIAYDEDFEHWVIMFCPICGEEVIPTLES